MTGAEVVDEGLVKAAFEAARTEDGGGGRVGDLDAGEELAGGRFVRREKARRLGGKLEVEVANGPADAGGGGGGQIGEDDLENRLGLLNDHVAGGGGLVKRVSGLKRFRELEAEVRAVGGNAAPKTLGEGSPVNAQLDDGESGT